MMKKLYGILLHDEGRKQFGETLEPYGKTGPIGK